MCLTVQDTEIALSKFHSLYSNGTGCFARGSLSTAIQICIGGHLSLQLALVGVFPSSHWHTFSTCMWPTYCMLCSGGCMWWWCVVGVNCNTDLYCSWQRSPGRNILHHLNHLNINRKWNLNICQVVCGRVNSNTDLYCS